MKNLSLVIPVYNAPDLARAAAAAVPELARTAEACGFELVLRGHGVTIELGADE